MSIDRQKVWSGSLNQMALGSGAPASSPRFYDTTLRDGEQSVGVIFGPEHKLELARLIDGLGVGRIEAGFPRVSEDDRQAIAMILRAGLKAEIWGFARALPGDVDAVTDLGLSQCVIEAPVSSFKMHALGLDEQVVLERIRTAVAHAAAQRVQVAFFGVDCTRGDMPFLERAYKVARDAGAAEFVMVDTLGIATPEAVRLLLGRARGWLGESAVLHFHGHNDFGMATACAIAAAQSGAAWIHGTVDGIGERAGNANLPEIALALDLLYGADTGMRFDRVRNASHRLRQIAHYGLEPWKSLVGENLFMRETGAVAAQFHIPQAIEPYASELVAAERGIVLGKKSGLASIRIKCETLGMHVDENRYPQLLETVKARAIAKGGLLDDAEFRDAVRALN
ncbi:hypothetical protein [Thiomonas sp.]|jgi:isopropylmalate/homocitrate/citramalate synthase|uniref:LeuA family protein n=1 Tax=Thiomonas sp. TaxID=2047785 RepID=UPI002622AF28|nr:hypothetical protein [Thiomonas sp.]